MTTRAADVTISIYWDDRWKKWGIVTRTSSSTRTATARTTSEIGEVEAYLLTQAVVREIEAFLPLSE